MLELHYKKSKNKPPRIRFIDASDIDPKGIRLKLWLRKYGIHNPQEIFNNAKEGKK